MASVRPTAIRAIFDALSGPFFSRKSLLNSLLPGAETVFDILATVPSLP